MPRLKRWDLLLYFSDQSITSGLAGGAHSRGRARAAASAGWRGRGTGLPPLPGLPILRWGRGEGGAAPPPHAVQHPAPQHAAQPRPPVQRPAARPRQVRDGRGEEAAQAALRPPGQGGHERGGEAGGGHDDHGPPAPGVAPRPGHREQLPARRLARDAPRRGPAGGPGPDPRAEAAHGDRAARGAAAHQTPRPGRGPQPAVEPGPGAGLEAEVQPSLRRVERHARPGRPRGGPPAGRVGADHARGSAASRQ